MSAVLSRVESVMLPKSETATPQTLVVGPQHVQLTKPWRGHPSSCRDNHDHAGEGQEPGRVDYGTGELGEHEVGGGRTGRGAIPVVVPRRG